MSGEDVDDLDEVDADPDCEECDGDGDCGECAGFGTDENGEDCEACQGTGDCPDCVLGNLTEEDLAVTQGLENGRR